MDETIKPFRWDVSRREQLGRLIEGVEPDTYDEFEHDLVTCSARVVDRAGDSDLVFVGRSPECIFDFLSGALSETAWRDRLRPLHVSLHDELWPTGPQRMTFRANLDAVGLAPHQVERRPRPIALVDIVDSGDTLGHLVGFVREWAEDGASRWRAVRPRLRVVGLTWRTHTSPKTWRWQQMEHAEWVRWLPASAVKNVSIPGRLYVFFSSEAPKMTDSFPPERWGDASESEPLRDEEARKGLALAVRLFDLGASRRGRDALTAQLVRQPSMREPWLRSLVLELRGTSRSRG